MKQNNQKNNTASLDEEKQLREKNLALYYEIELLRSRENDPAVAAEIKRKEEELRKNNKAYLRKYKMLFELDMQENEAAKKKETLPRYLKILLIFACGVAALIIVFVFYGRFTTEKADVPVESGHFVKWDDLEGASSAAENGYLISDDDYFYGNKSDTEYAQLKEDPRIPDIDAVPDNELLAERRHYEWMSGNGKTTIRYSPTIYMGIYKAYRSAARYWDSKNFYHYVADEFNANYITDIANHLRSIGSGMEYTEQDLALEAIHFVQSIPYLSDMKSVGEQEWPKYVIETLYDGCGDCEDKSFLLAGLLRELGFDAVLLVFNTHMAVGIADYDGAEGFSMTYRGKDYYYIDPSTPGWDVGHLPVSLRGAQCAAVSFDD